VDWEYHDEMRSATDTGVFTVAEGSESAERLRFLEVVGVQALAGAGTDT
jgi:hypothetical protein